MRRGAFHAIAFALDNLRGGLFAIGAGVLYLGLAGLSRPAANIVGGVVLMTLGAWPYLVRAKGRR